MTVELKERRSPSARAETWKLMQEVERLRYRAEQLDDRAEAAPPSMRGLFRDLAVQLRGIAEQRYAIRCGKALPIITPLKWPSEPMQMQGGAPLASNVGRHLPTIS